MIAKLMRTRVSQAAATIPMIGYALLWSDKVASYLELNKALGSGIFFATTTGRLAFLYLGAIFLTFAWLIYLWKCPPSIKRTPDLEDFLVSEMLSHNEPLLNAIREKLKTLISHTPHGASEGWKEDAPITLRTTISDAKVLEASSQPRHDVNRSLLWQAWFTYSDATNRRGLLACSVFFALGSIGMLVPSLEVFLMVVTRVIPKLMLF
ncbi:MAG: hypothetical protein ABL907_09465 [Hyphomicrobium sp.]